jgi:hypothetical protein
VTKNNLQSKIKEIIDRTDAAPFLFVGTGMSKRYVDAPSWSDLLKWAASLTGKDYKRYLQEADRRSNRKDQYPGPTIGSLIDKEFNDIWWESSKYKEERRKVKSSDYIYESPLKLQIAKKLQSVSNRDFPSHHEEEIKFLREATIDGVITTNYDTVLEDRLFPEYTSYTGQDEVIFSEQHDIAEIYKIHGSVKDPDSLVLTNEDYSRFDDKNAYLASKLITIFLEHPVIFLGYSISDSNIQTILSEIIYCLDSERLDTLGDRLIFVEYKRNEGLPEVGPHSRQVGGRDLRLTRVRAHDFTPIFKALAERKRHLNAKLVRQVKEEMYELVRANDPDEQLHVIDIEDLDEHQEVEIVVGVGVREQLSRVGLKKIGMNAIYRDLLDNGNRFDDYADEVVTVRIKNWITSQGGTYVPVYKYLRSGGLLDENLRVREEEVPPAVCRVAEMERECFQYDVAETTKAEYQQKTIQQVANEFSDPVAACRYMTLVSDPAIEDISDFLQSNLSLLNDQRGSLPFRWLACIYDRTKYGPGFEALESN